VRSSYVPDHNRSVHAPAERVDLEDDRSGAGRGGFVQDALDEWGKPKVDHPLIGMT
jgi:hypothetical protein